MEEKILKTIKEYNLIKLEVSSSKYNIIDDNILYFNNNSNKERGLMEK